MPRRGGPALNTAGLKHGDGDADLFRTIRQGVSGTQMPPYTGSARRADLAARQLHPQPAEPRRCARLRRAARWRPKATSRPAKRSSSARPRARPATRSTGAAASPGPICRTPDGSRRRRCGRRLSRRTTRCRPHPARAAVAAAAAGRRRSRSSRRLPTAARFAASAGTKTRSRCRWSTRPAGCTCSTR